MIRCIIYILVGKRSGRRCTGRHLFYHYGNASADVGSVDEIKTQLAKLGVKYLIVDPLDGYAEGKATLRMLEELVSSYGATAKVVFASADGKHRIYAVEPK